MRHRAVRKAVHDQERRRIAANVSDRAGVAHTIRNGLHGGAEQPSTPATLDRREGRRPRPPGPPRAPAAGGTARSPLSSPAAAHVDSDDRLLQGGALLLCLGIHAIEPGRPVRRRARSAPRSSDSGCRRLRTCPAARARQPQPDARPPTCPTGRCDRDRARARRRSPSASAPRCARPRRWRET